MLPRHPASICFVAVLSACGDWSVIGSSVGADLCTGEGEHLQDSGAEQRSSYDADMSSLVSPAPADGGSDLAGIHDAEEDGGVAPWTTVAWLVAGQAKASVNMFDADQWPDLLLAVKDLDGFGFGEYQYYSHIGLGAPNAPARVPLAASPMNAGAFVGDFDGDGLLDAASFVFARAPSPPPPWSFEGHLMTPKGSFGAAIPAKMSALGYGETADISGDGKIDIVGFDGSSRLVVIIEGLGDGRFSQPRSVPVPQTVRSLVTADADNDGWRDVVVTAFANANASSTDDGVYVLRNQRDGTFSLWWHDQVANLGAVQAGDLDGDGTLDLVTAGGDTWAAAPNGVSAFFGDGKGGFSRPVTFPVDARGQLHLGDVDGDGRVDVVVLARGGIVALTNQGGRVLQAEPVLKTTAASLDHAGDLDGDGRADLVATEQHWRGDTAVYLFFRRP